MILEFIVNASFSMTLFLALAGCNPAAKEAPAKEEQGTEVRPADDNPNLALASATYAEMSEMALQHMAGFAFDKWETMLADSVVYAFPDGDENTRTTLVGKSAVMEWWRKWHQNSGIESMTMSEFNHIPVEVKGEPKGGAKPGVYVISYFTNKMVYKGKPVSVRMNFSVHFDSNKKIDRYTTYYDRTPIIKALEGKDLLGSKK